MTYSVGCDTIDMLTLHTLYWDLLWVVMRAKPTHCQQTPQFFLTLAVAFIKGIGHYWYIYELFWTLLLCTYLLPMHTLQY